MRANLQKKLIVAIASLVAMLLLSSTVAFAEDATTYTQGALYYTVSDASATITGCFGRDETVEVPASIAGIPVNAIAAGAFTGNAYVKEIILPDTIMTIEEGAFASNITVLQKQGSAAASAGETGDVDAGVTEGTGSTANGNAAGGQNAATASGNSTSGNATGGQTAVTAPGNTASGNAAGGQNAAAASGNTTADGSYIVIQQGSSASSSASGSANASSGSAVSSTQENAASNGGAVGEQDAGVDSQGPEKEDEGTHVLWGVAVAAVVAVAAGAAISVIVWKRKKAHPKQQDEG